MSAPAATSARAWAIAASGSRNRPPSENESSVTLRMPNRSEKLAIAELDTRQPGRVRSRIAPTPSASGNTSSFSTHTRTRSTRGSAKHALADPLGEALAQIDMAGCSDFADRGDDLLVIDDAAAVFAGKDSGGGRGQIDRDAHPLLALALLRGGCRCCTSAPARAR